MNCNAFGSDCAAQEIDYSGQSHEHGLRAWSGLGPPATGRDFGTATLSQRCASLPLGYSRRLPPGGVTLGPAQTAK
jgi:hypothetical protein